MISITNDLKITDENEEKCENKHKKEHLKFKIYASIFILMAVFLTTFNIVYCAAISDPTLVNKLNSAMKKILTYLQKLATPIAGVTIAVGVIMRKLSFGDEEKMLKGKKVIINAIIGYAIIISIDLIIKCIESLI